MNQPPTLLKNMGTRHNAISFSLAGTKSNRSAIGARVTIEVAGRKQMAEVASGGSYFSQNALTLYFGIGDANLLDRVEVRWPSGDKQKWSSVPANQHAGTGGHSALRVIVVAFVR